MKNKIIDIIAKCTCVDSTVIESNIELANIPEWSSIIYVMVIAGIEEEFSVRLTGEELFDVDTVNDLINLVQEKCNK